MARSTRSFWILRPTANSTALKMPSPAAAAAAARILTKSVPSTRVVALREVVADYKSQGPLWGRLYGFAASHRIALKHQSPCFAIFYDPGYKPSDVDTEVCLAIEDGAVAPDDTKEFKVYTTPELSRAASYTHTGSYDGLVPAYDELFGWIAANNERIVGPVREIYHVGMDKYEGDETKLVTEIIVPLA